MNFDRKKVKEEYTYDFEGFEGLQDALANSDGGYANIDVLFNVYNKVHLKYGVNICETKAGQNNFRAFSQNINVLEPALIYFENELRANLK